MEQYFAGARVGDSVWEAARGEGKVIEVHTQTIRIAFKVWGTFTFSLDGALFVDSNQTLFYSKPIFALPPPPKRMVKKVVEGWVNIYLGSFLQWTSTIHPTRAQADEAVMDGRLGPACLIRHEYEEAEEPPMMVDNKGNRSIFDDVDD